MKEEIVSFLTICFWNSFNNELLHYTLYALFHIGWASFYLNRNQLAIYVL